MKKWLDNLKISKKLIFSFLIATFITLVVGAVGIKSINSIDKSSTLLYEENTLGLQYLGSAYADFNGLRYTSIKLTEGGTSAQMEQYSSSIKQLCASVDDLLVKYEGTYLTSDVTTDFMDFKVLWERYKTDMDQVLQTQQINASTFQLGDSLEGGFQKLMEVDAPDAKLKCDNNQVLARNAIILMAAAILVGVVLSLVLGTSISASISKPVRKFAAFAELLAVGDIDVNKVLDEKDKRLKLRKDEIGVLAGAFHEIMENTTEQAQEVRAIAEGDLSTVVTIRSEFDVIGNELTELVKKFRALAISIVSAAEQVDSGAKQVADSSMALSQGAAEQASSVEELTASLEEVTSETTQNAQNAQITDELARNIRKDAEDGNTRMTEMLRAMDEINTSSDSISKIIKVIEDIAFQTNILALNAAVEAARAGQYGKGFAVVADEVRNLAAQSSKAAKETTDLIETSVRKVETGTKIANETAGALGKIVTGISKAAELIGAIATASNEQSAALEQINQGITQVSQVVQSNAAASEESAASSEELSNQSQLLKESVGVFKLEASAASMPTVEAKKPKTKEPNSEKEKKSSSKGTSKPVISLPEGNLGKY